MSESVSDIVIAIIAEQMGCDPSEIKPESRLMDDLNADSIDRMEIAMMIEERLDCEIPDEDTEDIRTVDDAIQYAEPIAERLERLDETCSCGDTAIAPRPGLRLGSKIILDAPGLRHGEGARIEHVGCVGAALEDDHQEEMRIVDECFLFGTERMPEARNSQLKSR